MNAKRRKSENGKADRKDHADFVSGILDCRGDLADRRAAERNLVDRAAGGNQLFTVRRIRGAGRTVFGTLPDY